ncbi:MAG: hypothetical protein FJ405_17200, partial [Verrucomicrobia bacterium]|nr:hypothetical protein [Verrucomicrobiota bacterium]
MDPTITVGETVRFTVRFEIDVPPQLFDVRWFRNDQLIPEATGLDYVTPPQQPDNNGDRYHAVVQSPFGPRETKHSTLRVLVPFLIEKHPESLKVVETQTARFCVSVSNPSGFDVSYQWMKGNSPIPGADQACLVIDRVSLSDEGIYRVLVTSEKAGQKILSEPAELQVLRMLRIVRQSESALKVEGQPFQLFVDAVGAGTLSYQWFKDGRPVRGASSRALQFRPLSTHDTGEYVVEVSDSRIRIRSNPIRLTVSRRENREEPGKVPVHEPGTVVIKLRPGPAERLRAAIAQGTDFRQINFPPDVAALNARFGATAVRQAHPKARENQQQLQNIFLLTISQAENVTAASKAYASLGSVAFAEPNPYAKAFAVPNDPHYPLLWGMQTIRADLAWNISTGTGVIVAVVDSGVHQAHCDLAANIWQNPGENGLDGMGNNKASNGVDDDGNGYVDDFAGWDFVSDDNIPQDGNGHGTHVAGTIAAVANNLE